MDNEVKKKKKNGVERQCRCLRATFIAPERYETQNRAIGLERQHVGAALIAPKHYTRSARAPQEIIYYA